MSYAVKPVSLSFADYKSYVAAALFVTGNIIAPRLLHMIPQGGAIWLPIYFFTLLGAWLYGWHVGLLTAIASPLAGLWLFGMPDASILTTIMLKSCLLAGLASMAARRETLPVLLRLSAVVLCYQILGTLGEWALCGDLYKACADLRTGIPGMLTQIAGGSAAIYLITRR